MAQTFTDNTYDGAHNAATDLQNMEANFAALKSSFSGTASPGSAVTGQLHMDTDNNVLKVYDTSWLGIMHGDVDQKIWVYRNSAIDGWVIDSSVSDVVLAAKGGGTYTTAGATAGSWTISGLSANAHTHGFSGSGSTGSPSGTDDTNHWRDSLGSSHLWLASSSHTHGVSVSGTTGSTGSAVSSNGTWRIAAAVNTLQYLDI